MNILETLVQIRDDLKTWVTNNINAINSKIDEKTIPIDNELSAESTNPVQNKIIHEKIEEINTLIGDEPVATQISTAIAKQEHFSGDYYDLTNAPNILEDEAGNMIVADEAGNIIFKVDTDGIHSTSLSLNGESIQSLLDDKVNKEDGKGLSSNDYTNEDKAKLALISSELATASIDSELSTTSDNPVKNKVITNAITQVTNDVDTLETLVGNKAVSTQITEAVSKIKSFSGDYGDLTNAPNITENDSDDVIFADNNGNIIVKVDKDGIHSNGLVINGENILSTLNAKFDKQSEVLEEHDRLRIGLVPLGTSIVENADLNTTEYISVGSYYCSANKTVATLLNCPTVHAFLMQVYSPLTTTIDNEETSQWVYRIRKILTYEGSEFTQVVYSSSEPGVFVYKPWQQVAKTENIVAAMASKMDSKPISIEFNTTGELTNYGGFLDFHYHDANGNPAANADYSSRIIENAEGIISVNNVKFDISNASMSAAAIKVTSAQAISDSVVRNSKLVTTATTPTVNGEIYWLYE